MPRRVEAQPEFALAALRRGLGHLRVSQDDVGGGACRRAVCGQVPDIGSRATRPAAGRGTDDEEQDVSDRDGKERRGPRPTCPTSCQLDIVTVPEPVEDAVGHGRGVVTAQPGATECDQRGGPCPAARS